MANRPKPLLQLILDGFGLGKACDKHAIALATTLFRDNLQQIYPMTALDCPGDAVSLPGNQRDNAKERLLHIGGGDLLRPTPSGVSHKIAISAFFNNSAPCPAVDETLQKIVDAISRIRGQIFLATDLGNIEQMTKFETSQPHAAHTADLAPLAHVGGNLADLTMPGSLCAPQPAEIC